MSEGIAVAYFVALWPKLSETFIRDEIAELRRRGVKPSIFSIKASAERPAGPDTGAAIHCISLRRRPIAALASCAATLLRHPRRFLRALAVASEFRLGEQRLLQAAWSARRLPSEAQVLYAHFTDPAEVACLVSILTERPFIFKVHTLGPVLRPPPGFRRLIGLASGVLTESETTLGALRGRYGAAIGKFRCVHAFVPDDFFAPREPKPPTPLSVLCLSRLSLEKGHDLLIGACRELDRRGRDFSCDIIGDGPEGNRLQELIAACGLAGKVRLHGALPTAEVLERMRRADVFVLACRESEVDGRRAVDGLPRALAEAMAAGLCVISTAIGGIPELVEDGVTGLLVGPDDLAALVGALEQALADPLLRRRLGAAARARVRRLCDVDTSSAALIGAIREAASTRPIGRRLPGAAEGAAHRGR